jgi:hypothetical protein
VDGGIEKALGLQCLLRTSVTMFHGGLVWEGGCTQISCLIGALSGIIGIWTCSGRHVEIDARAVWLLDDVASIIQ